MQFSISQQCIKHTGLFKWVRSVRNLQTLDKEETKGSKAYAYQYIKSFKSLEFEFCLSNKQASFKKRIRKIYNVGVPGAHHFKLFHFEELECYWF